MKWTKVYIVLGSVLPTGFATTKSSVKPSIEEFLPQKKLVGTNTFFQEITSGTCAFYGFDSITDTFACNEAAKSYGYTFHNQQNRDDMFTRRKKTQEGLNSCFLQPRLNLPFDLPGFIAGFNYQLKLNRDESCKSDIAGCECTETRPCFCTSKSYVQPINKNHRRNKRNGQFSVSWSLSLGGRESLLEESAFLKAAFEQSVKDYINNDILCSDNLAFKGAEFFGVEIKTGNDGKNGKRKAVSGNGSCKGDLSKCKKPLKVKKKNQNVGTVSRTPGKSRVVKANTSKDSFCEIFLQSTIFDAFAERLLTASAFNYNVDVDVLNDLEGNIDLSYEVSFEPEKGDGLDEVDDVDMDAQDPVEIEPVCAESQCSTQRDVIRNIFLYFDIDFDEEKHECMILGINCNEADLVTHVWLVNYGFEGLFIPEAFSKLPSLIGLYLGGNQLVGGIPSSFAKLRNLQMLWLEDNDLTGTIPTQLGNVRPLLEINFHENWLEGTIPTELSKLSKLQMLNIGNNNLSGPIPEFLTKKKPTVNPIECVSFPFPFKKVLKKLGIQKNSSEASTDELIPLSELNTLSLYKNSLTGQIPSTLGLLLRMADLSLAENNLSGSIPSEFGKLDKLNVLDIHDNSLTESIPSEIGRLNKLTILNLIDNDLTGMIPSEIGRLLQLNELTLDNNELTGPIPKEIGNLFNLNYLTFGGNSMSGEIPTEIGNLESLNNLDIRGYTVTSQSGSKAGTGTIPTELGKLTSWKYVVFEGNGVQGAVPSEFGELEASEAMWLKNQDLSGSIPSDLGKLKSMSLLSVGGNSLGGPIPTDLGALGGLTAFDVASNTLSGEIPKEIGGISELKLLSLGNENITGAMPSDLGRLSSIEFMFLAGSKLSGEIPSEIGNLLKLKAFGAANGSFSGQLPSELGVLTNLINLDLENNAVTGTIPTEVGQMDSVVKINLGKNNLIGSIPTELGNLESIEWINLGANNLSSTIPSELGNVVTLEQLYLDSNELTGSIPFQLLLIPALVVLVLDDNEFSGEIPTNTAGSFFDAATRARNLQLPQLSLSIEELSLMSNSFTGSISSYIGLFSSLQGVYLVDNKITGTLPTEFGVLTTMKVVRLGDNNITGSIPTEIGNLQNLTGLGLAGNAFTGIIPSELGNIQTLETVIISDNDFTGSVPTELMSLESLTKIDISGNNITGDLWFMCELQDYTIDEGSTLNCSDFCGTVDEECNETSIGESTCGDVGCNSNGVPSCSDACRLDYSTCLANSDSITFQLDLLTDDNGWQNEWDVYDSSGLVVQSGILYRNNLQYHEFYCMETDCYTFELRDSGEDGICCEESSGSYSINIDGTILSNAIADFGSSIIHLFGTCTSAPIPSTATLEPTLSPSRNPTANPTTGFPSLRPSLIPTSLPSEFPSMSPSFNPSPVPSVMPSTIPSAVPTSLPSEFPSMGPSFNPSAVPTSLPTLIPSSNPSSMPSSQPSLFSSLNPSSVPTEILSDIPSMNPSFTPTVAPIFDVISSTTVDATVNFGKGLFVTDDYIFIGAPNDGNGKVYMFSLSYVVLRVFTASDGLGSDTFGHLFAVLDDTIYICSRINSNVGAVYVFTISTGVQTHKLEASDVNTAGAQDFGTSIAVSSAILVVGAYLKNSQDGGVYIFDTATLTEQTIVLGSNLGLTVGSRAGMRLALSGQRIFCTAHFHDSRRGALVVLDQLGTVLDTVVGENIGDQYGRSFFVKDDILLVGAPRYNANNGRGYHYTLDSPVNPTTLTLTQTFDALAVGLQNGFSTFIDTNYLYVSGKVGAGVVYRYAHDGTAMGQTVEPQSGSGDFGFSVRGNDDMIIVTAPLTGVAYRLYDAIFQ